MFKLKQFNWLYTIVPFILLLVISGYFANYYWQKYQQYSALQNTLDSVKILQNYEDAVLDEVLCLELLPKKSKNKLLICQDRIDKTIDLEKQIKKNHNNLEHWTHQILTIKRNLQKYSIEDFEKLLSRNKVTSSVKSYLDKVEFDTNIVEEKALLRLYTELSDITYTTELENFLITYHVTKKLSVSMQNMIFWDKLVETSYIMNIDEDKSIPSVKEKLLNIIQNKSLQKVLNQIDDMRITILTGQMDPYSDHLNWIIHIEKKLQALKDMKFVVENKLYSEIKMHSDNALLLAVIFIVIFLFSILSLVYTFSQYKQKSEKEKSLLAVVNRINALLPYDKKESKELDSLLKDAKNEKDMYTYIDQSVQFLNDERKISKDDVEAKTQYLSTMTHEIRTPLNSIIGFSNLLKEIGVTDEQEEFVTHIENSSQKLLTIVNDVLDLSKMNADKMEIENISFDIFETVETTVASFTQQTDQKDIELGLFVDPFLSHYFLGDAIKLSQVLTNLIANAIKFTDTYGKINIFVQRIHDSNEEAEIKFAVHDTGIGLSKDEMKNIFNPYTQAKKETRGKYGGTGLGLTISSKMVELMDSKLEVESKVNYGSTFSFTLRLVKDNHKVFKTYPDFSGIKVGLALPVRTIKRQLDTNLEIYIRHLGAEFKIYYYEELFEDDVYIELPDIMIFDHHYARLAGELEMCVTLDCKTVLLTNGTLHQRINRERHVFSDILFTPISLHKTIRILDTMREHKIVETSSSNKISNVESFDKIKALVADDNMINRKLVKIILEKIGVSVTLVSDGKEAVKKYKDDYFDIIFMDIQMPIMDGVEATHNILKFEKENNLPHVPIIALTANANRGDKEKYLAEGMDDYTPKPLQVDKIKLLISKYCIT